MGTGIRDMIRRCQEAGLPEPEICIDGGFWILTIRRKVDFGLALTQSKKHDEAHDEAHELSDTEKAILRACEMAPQGTTDLLKLLGYQSRTGNFKKALARLLDESKLLEQTLPETPRSKRQKYRLTPKGREILKNLES